MVRISKQQEKRQRCPKRRRAPAPKTGALKDALPQGYKPHTNGVQGELAQRAFISQVKPVSKQILR